MAKLTPEQIKLWRKVLVPSLGPWALIMPESDIEQYRQALQLKVGKLVEELKGDDNGQAEGQAETETDRG